MKRLLGMETLEPRTLLTGLVGLPLTIELQTPADSAPTPTADVGPMRAAADVAAQATVEPLPAADLPTACEVAVEVPVEVAVEVPVIDATPHGNLPAPLPSSNMEQPGTSGEANSPVDVDPPDLKADSEPTEPPKWETPDVGSDKDKDTDTSGYSPPKPLVPPSANDSDQKPDSISRSTPSGPWPARTELPITPPFVWLSAPSSPEQQADEAVASASFGASANEASDAYHYFEPLGPSYHYADGLHAEPLANVAVREMFIAFWLMTAPDNGDVQSSHEAVIAVSAQASPPPAPSSAHPPEQRQPSAAIAEQAELVDRALAAILSADEVLREADAACAVAISRSVAASAQLQTFAVASKSSQPAHTQASTAQASTPSWQVGMCSLVAMLFSFRAPAERSQGCSAVRKKLLRARA